MNTHEHDDADNVFTSAIMLCTMIMVSLTEGWMLPVL